VPLFVIDPFRYTKAIVRRLSEEVWNKGDSSVVNQVYGPDLSYQGRTRHSRRAERPPNDRCASAYPTFTSQHGRVGARGDVGCAGGRSSSHVELHAWRSGRWR
jgi:hypothetical protein